MLHDRRPETQHKRLSYKGVSRAQEKAEYEPSAKGRDRIKQVQDQTQITQR